MVIRKSQARGKVYVVYYLNCRGDEHLLRFTTTIDIIEGVMKLKANNNDAINKYLDEIDDSELCDILSEVIRDKDLQKQWKRTKKISGMGEEIIFGLGLTKEDANEAYITGQMQAHENEQSDWDD